MAIIQLRYALDLGDDGRILSVTYEQYATDGMPIVDILPDGDISDYRYEEGQYILDPLPVTESSDDEISESEALSILLGEENV